MVRGDQRRAGGAEIAEILNQSPRGQGAVYRNGEPERRQSEPRGCADCRDFTCVGVRLAGTVLGRAVGQEEEGIFIEFESEHHHHLRNAARRLGDE